VANDHVKQNLSGFLALDPIRGPFKWDTAMFGKSNPSMEKLQLTCHLRSTLVPSLRGRNGKFSRHLGTCIHASFIAFVGNYRTD
jgi:hypothetical protein